MPDVVDRTRGDSGAGARPLITAMSSFQPEDRALRIWIDATMPGSEIRVFGMTLLERLLRGLAQTGATMSEVRVEIAAGAPIPASLPRKLFETLPLHWSREDLPLAHRFERAVQAAEGDPMLALSADTVVDTRVIAHLCDTAGSFAFIHGEGEERGALLRLEGELPESAEGDASLLLIAERAIRTGEAKEFTESDFSGYIAMLRRHLAPYLFRIPDAESRDRVERFLFWSNYKGSTDFMTKYVYPPLVWTFVHPLARWRVHPNWVTGFDWIATFATVPLFASGAWVPGLLLAYLMSVFDSVDGKLARLTYTSSKFGEVLDHSLDIVHPPVWYMAWAWWLGGGGVASPPFQASLWLLAFYVLDRVCAGVFKARLGESIHGFTPLDEKVRTFISRRNVNLVLFTSALLVDWIAPGHGVARYTFYVIVAWQVACFAWHAERVVQFWNARVRR
jgi:phosphatidylglycerophosphate synthase